MVKRQNIVHDV